MKPERVITKKVKVGNIFIGGGEKIAVQSMTNSDPSDFEGTLMQVRSLEKAGCDVVRMTVPDMVAVRTLAKIKENALVPIVADVHFDHHLAVEACRAGADKIRINPGNIGSRQNVYEVARAAREEGVAIRVGVNSGSIESEFLQKYGKRCPEALCDSALDKVKMLEYCDFTDIVISVKSSSVSEMVAASRLLSKKTQYPLHIGVTEAGTSRSGMIKSAVGIGALLIDGIGDTVRVSLTTNDLTEEVRAARAILDSCGISDTGINIISCPTCGRTKIDLVKIVNALEKRLAEENITAERRITVAVMGCGVNGPGEAFFADVGIAGSKGEALLFKKGEIVGKIKEDKIIDRLTEEVRFLAH